MKKILLLCLLWATHAVQGSTYKTWVVETRGGMRISFRLSETPQIVYAGQTMRLNTETESHYFEISDMAYFYNENMTTNIGNSTLDPLCVSYADADHILIEGTFSPADIKVCTAEGEDMSAHVTCSPGKMVIHVAEIPRGDYVISVRQKKNLKFYKR